MLQLSAHLCGCFTGVRGGALEITHIPLDGETGTVEGKCTDLELYGPFMGPGLDVFTPTRNVVHNGKRRVNGD
jgi:hypothetical protein